MAKAGFSIFRRIRLIHQLSDQAIEDYSFGGFAEIQHICGKLCVATVKVTRDVPSP
ncbi:MAG: hypothetical protein WA949_19905 [Phormidesmis sp.]